MLRVNSVVSVEPRLYSDIFYINGVVFLYVFLQETYDEGKEEEEKERKNRK